METSSSPCSSFFPACSFFSDCPSFLSFLSFRLGLFSNSAIRVATRAFSFFCASPVRGLPSSFTSVETSVPSR